MPSNIHCNCSVICFLAWWHGGMVQDWLSASCVFVDQLGVWEVNGEELLMSSVVLLVAWRSALLSSHRQWLQALCNSWFVFPVFFDLVLWKTNLLYSRKIWRGIKFGGFGGWGWNCQIKICQYFFKKIQHCSRNASNCKYFDEKRNLFGIEETMYSFRVVYMINMYTT